MVTTIPRDHTNATNLRTGIGFVIKYMMLYLFLMSVFLICGNVPSKAHAATGRHHEAHEHGVAQMNVAIEGDTLHIDFISPAANIVGFEHRPSTQAQKRAVDTAIAQLKDGARMFRLPPKALGKLVESVVTTDIAREEKQETHAELDDDHDKGHAHDKKHDEEDHHAEENERHSEFKVQYRFTCKHPDKLEQIEVMLFKSFPAIEHIEVQIITESKQTALELTSKKNKVLF